MTAFLAAATPMVNHGAETWMWLLFGGLVVALLVLDLGVMHRGAHRVSLREALWANVFWVAVGLGFGVLVLLHLGRVPAGEYYAGYLLERALSVDNVFVFVVVLTYFQVPTKLQNGVLFWGLIMALFMRAGFILAGVALIDRYDWIIYFFGVLLLYTGFQMAVSDMAETDPSKNLALRALRKVMPVSDDFHGQRYFVRLAGVLTATPLAAAIFVIAATDLIFAIDSIPAIFAVTTDKFIIYTSNAFALLGLRAMYFLLADAVDRFVHLQTGLAIVLVFVGVKFLITDLWEIPIELSLGFIVLAAGGSIIWSLLATRGHTPLMPGEPEENLEREPRRPSLRDPDR